MDLAEKIQTILARASENDVDLLLKEALDACEVAQTETHIKAAVVLLTPFFYQVIYKKLTPTQVKQLEISILELEKRVGPLEGYVTRTLAETQLSA